MTANRGAPAAADRPPTDKTRPGRFAWERALFADPNVPPTRLLVLLVVGAHVDARTGLAHPGIARLAALTRLNERTVREHLKEAEKAGWLQQVQRGHRRWDGTVLASIYELANPGPEATPPPSPRLKKKRDEDPDEGPTTGAHAPEEGPPTTGAHAPEEGPPTTGAPTAPLPAPGRASTGAHAPPDIPSVDQEGVVMAPAADPRVDSDAPRTTLDRAKSLLGYTTRTTDTERLLAANAELVEILARISSATTAADVDQAVEDLDVEGWRGAWPRHLEPELSRRAEILRGRRRQPPPFIADHDTAISGEAKRIAAAGIAEATAALHGATRSSDR